MSLQTNDETRFLLPVIPCFALLLGGLAGVARSGRLPALVALVLVAQFALVTVQSFAGGTPKALRYSRLRPPEHSAWPPQLRRIAGLTCTAQVGDRFSVVGVDYPWLNSDTLSMFAADRFALAGRRCRYTTLGYATSDAEAAWRRVRDGHPPYYVSVDYGNPANPLPRALADSRAYAPFNRVNAPVFAHVLRSGHFVFVPGGRQSGLVVLRYCYKPIELLVRDFYRRALRREPSSRELSGWTARLTRARSRGQALAAVRGLGSSVFGSTEYVALRTSDARFVSDLYIAYLARRPDPAGYRGWIGKLGNGTSRSVVRAAFADGPEFRRDVSELCVRPPLI
jgi:hypothetical protein